VADKGEGEKEGTTSARSRATIGDRLSSSLVPGNLSDGGSEQGEKKVRQGASPPPPLSNYSLTPRAIYLRSGAIITCYYLILTLLAI